MKLTTQAAVQSLSVPAGLTEKIFFDDELAGLGVRCRPSGDRKWIVAYTINGKSRRVTLGPTAVFTPDQARNWAKKTLAAVCLGRDPAAEIQNAPRQTLEQHITRKALTFLNQGIEPACYLYRHYHPSGDLLYVGVSLEPLRRQDTHVKTAEWRGMICQIMIEPFATREEALSAEQLAIRSEFPKFNITHNGRRHPLQELRRHMP